MPAEVNKDSCVCSEMPTTRGGKCPHCSYTARKIQCNCGAWISRKSTICRECSNRARSSLVDRKCPEYNAWARMLHKCRPGSAKNSPKFKDISVCPEWSDYAVFLRDVGKRKSSCYRLYRKDLKENFHPDNVFWGLPSDPRIGMPTHNQVAHKGERRTLSGWAKHLGMNSATLYQRYSDGDRSPDLFRPIRTRKSVKTYPNRLVAFRGYQKTLTQWAELLRLSLVILESRYSCGERPPKLFR